MASFRPRVFSFRRPFQITTIFFLPTGNRRLCFHYKMTLIFLPSFFSPGGLAFFNFYLIENGLPRRD